MEHAIGRRRRTRRRDARDSVATTHPVVQHVETVEQANQAFDEITYQRAKP
jgi:aminopeptidase N